MSAVPPRYANSQGLRQHSAEVSNLIAGAFPAQKFDYWRKHLKTMRGQWAAIQCRGAAAHRGHPLAGSKNPLLLRRLACEHRPGMAVVGFSYRQQSSSLRAAQVAGL